MLRKLLRVVSRTLVAIEFVIRIIQYAIASYSGGRDGFVEVFIHTYNVELTRDEDFVKKRIAAWVETQGMVQGKISAWEETLTNIRASRNTLRALVGHAEPNDLPPSTPTHRKRVPFKRVPAESVLPSSPSPPTPVGGQGTFTF